MEFPASIVGPAPAEALPEAEARDGTLIDDAAAKRMGRLGNVSRCVFFPCSPVNVKKVFARGGTLDDVWAHPFFADIRRWQREYGYREANEPCPDCGNWLAPCIIRDHHSTFLELVRRHEPAPTDEDARAALLDSDYHEGLARFGRELEDSTGLVRRERYKEGKGTPPAPMKRR